MLELSATDRIRPVLADPARMHPDPTSRPMARPLIRVPDLEAAIDGVVKSYDGPEEINNLESAALPNKRAVVEAFCHLRPAIYMGFYATRPLSRDNLRYSVSEHLYPAYEILVEQIARAVTYEERFGKAPAARPEGWNEDVVLRLFKQLPELRRQLNADVKAAFDGDPAAKSIEEVVFSYPAIQAITAHRVAHVLYRAKVPMIPRILSEYAHSETGIDIHAGAQIGQRFFIDHGTGVVVGETSVIGDNVKLYQGVTLGALSTRRERADDKRHPTLEDDVTIYAGATILGGETVIGKGATVGGNVWITASVPPGTKIFGRARE
jgi:serine O-acetyltransferase